MGQKVTPTFPVGVHRLAERIALWRRQRKKRSPMPKELWAAAVSLARVHGVYPIAGALRVNYGGLKKRVAGGRKRGGQRAAEFIELDRVPFLERSEFSGTVVELWGADGSKLVVRLSGREGLDVLSLVDAIRRHGV